MSAVNVLEVPQDILDTARLTVDELKVEMAVYLYAQGRLSIGKAVPALTAAIPVWAVFLGLGFCSLVGLFLGIYPASRAARLDPIVALHYE